MAKNTVQDWDTVAANNSDIGGINIGEGCPAKNINNAIRELMAQYASYLDEGVTFGSGNDTLTYNDSTNEWTWTADGVAGSGRHLTGQLRLSSTTDASLTSTAHALQIGPTDGVNLRIDNNEILTVNNASAGSTLSIPYGVTFDTGVSLAVADGGTGAVTAADARTNLGANNATNLTTGTLPSGRLSGNYSFADLTLSGRISIDVTGTQTTPTYNLGGLTGPTGMYRTIPSSLDQINFTAGGEVKLGVRSDGAILAINDGVFTGAGGGLTGVNASQLGGQAGSYYLNLSNSTGTLPNARVSGAYDGITNLGMTGTLTIQNTAPQIKLLDTTSGQYSARLRVDGNNTYFDSSTDDVTFGEVFRFELDTKIGYVNNSRIITAAAGTAYDSARLGGTTAASIQSDIDSKAPLASPALTGNPTAPTQSAGNNSTRLATTAFVTTAINNIDFGSGNAGLSAGAIGTYAFAYRSSATSFGGTVAGSGLAPAAAGDTGTGSLSGTWMCMGRTTASAGGTNWLRVL